MKSVCPFVVFAVALLSTIGRETEAETVLDRYVAAPDPHYGSTLTRTEPGEGYTGYVLDMTSQQWRGAAEVDRPLWRHWLVVVRPKEVATRTGLLLIGGGSSDRPAPQINPILALIAVETHSVVAELRQIPNQPLVFAGDGQKRSEDAIIAYSWEKFLATGDDTWPLRLPMTKSVVRAMDTVTAFCGSAAGGNVAIDKFVLAGASKRGWTAWTAAAVDRRVVGLVPAVIDLLNLEPSFEHQYRAYGYWAPAIGDFERAGIMRRAHTPQLGALLRIEDPYSYRDRLTMPKYIVNSAGDQYFTPDASRFYFDGLAGETYLRYVPNTDHRLRDPNAVESAVAFYQSLLSGTPRPRFSWAFAPDGTIRVETRTKPTKVMLWQATNPQARDFRLQTIGAAYASTPLAVEGDRLYVAKVAAPARGWTAFFVELTFPGPGDYPFVFTTGVRITPDTLPFGPPPQALH
jgi:PhoPQ-activated pathogenicity-related protein